MSYKSDFASNNADLQSILDMVNALPDKVNKCKITIKRTSSGASYNQAKATINGTVYNCDYVSNGAEETIEVDPGTEVILSVSGSGAAGSKTAIIVDGSTVAASGTCTYTHTVSSDTVIELSSDSYSAYYYGKVVVTTSETTSDPATDSVFTPTDSGGTSYKSKFADNNLDLQKILECLQQLFAEKVIPVVITGSLDASAYWVTIGGVRYSSAANVEVKPGDTITFETTKSGFPLTSVTVDGSMRYINASNSYVHTVPENATRIDIVLGGSNGTFNLTTTT